MFYIQHKNIKKNIAESRAFLVVADN